MSRQIVGQGTPESHWQAWLEHRRLVSLSADRLLKATNRVVIVSPHPDDEILATAGIMQYCFEASLPCMVIAVTSGEASHPASSLWPPQKLSQTREQESAQALALLCPGSKTIYLRLQDGHVSEQRSQLLAELQQRLRPSDAVFCPWRYDGHPDHEATGRACAVAAGQVGCTLFEVPIWTWHWAVPGDSRVPWHRAVSIPMSVEQQALKRQAVSCFTTQLLPDLSTGRQAVLPHWATARLLRTFELVFL